MGFKNVIWNALPVLKMIIIAWLVATGLETCLLLVNVKMGFMKLGHNNVSVNEIIYVVIL